MKPCLVISLNPLLVLQACCQPSPHLVESRGETGETGKCDKRALEPRPTPSDNSVFLVALDKHTTTSCKSKNCTVFWLKWSAVHDLSIISHRPVTSSNLKQERSFIRRSVSTFLQLFIVMVFKARQGRLLGSVIHLLFR